MSGITVACLDMAGTTVAEEGSVMSAFRAAMEQAGLPRGTDRYDRAADIVQATKRNARDHTDDNCRRLGAVDVAPRPRHGDRESIGHAKKPADVRTTSTTG